MKTIIIYLLIILFVLPARAQERLYPYSNDGIKWGLTNTRRQVVASPQFDKVYLIEDVTGYAFVKNNEKTGVMDSTGRLTIPCKYEKLYSTAGTNGYAELPNGKYILVDLKTEKLLRPEQFDDLSDAGNVIRVTLNGKQGCINAITSRNINKIMYDQVLVFPRGIRARVKKNDKYGIMNPSTGAIIVPIKYDDLGYIYNNSYTKLMQLVATEGNTTIYFDENGNVQKERYIEVGYQSTEHIIAGETGNGKIYIIGTTWLATEYLGNDSWKVMIKRTTGPDKYEILATTELKGYSDLDELEGYDYKEKSLLIKAIKDGHSGVIDWTEYVLIKAVKDGHTGLIDWKGNVLVPFMYDDIADSGDYFKIFKDNKIGLLRRDYSVLRKPTIKSFMGIFSDGGRLIEMPDGRQGYMDSNTGEVFLPGLEE